MICKSRWSRQTTIIALCIGIASLAFGVISAFLTPEQSEAASRLSGMLTGFGFGILVVAAVRLIRSKVISKEKLEEEAIDKQDERNIAITRMAGLVGFYTGGAVLCVFVFLFTGMGYMTPAYACLAGLYMMAGAFVIAGRVLRRRM